MFKTTIRSVATPAMPALAVSAPAAGIAGVAHLGFHGPAETAVETVRYRRHGMRRGVVRRHGHMFRFGRLPLVYGAPAHSAARPFTPDERADFMAGVCNSAGGGASTNPDGTVSCVDPDGNDALDPVPAPD